MTCGVISLLSTCLTILCISLPARGSHYEIYLDPNRHYRFQWSVDYRDQAIDVTLTAKFTTMSWFAFGFSDYGDVTSADLVAFWTDRHGNEHLVDGHTDRYGIFYPDKQQDYHLTAVSSRQGDVVIQFRRQFDTCDKNDYVLDNGTTHFIYLESKYPVESPIGYDVTKLHHGLQRAQILKPDIPEPEYPPDTWSFEVRAPEILVPAEETTYWWHTTVLPDIPQTHHIIQYESVIQESNRDLVHHMEVFHCEVPKGASIPYFSGPGSSEGKPDGLSVCRQVIGAWAMGAEAMVYPEEAGVPIGGQGFSCFALLEVHYNNPGKKAGRIDTSGIRFYVTSRLRKYDAGIMELGIEYINKMAIPPRQTKFLLSGYCTHDCTKVGLAHGGMHVFASQLHTHLTGKRVYTKHVRDGIELPELNRDSHYSPHFQEIRRLPQPVEVLPGDELITTCEYNTMKRRKATVVGFSISDEMCVNYIHYYPKTDLEVCKSSVQTHALDRMFSFMRYHQGANISPADGYRANYKSIDWTPQTVQGFSHVYTEAPLSMQCNKSDGTRFPGDWEHSRIPKISQPFQISDGKKC